MESSELGGLLDDRLREARSARNLSLSALTTGTTTPTVEPSSTVLSRLVCTVQRLGPARILTRLLSRNDDAVNTRVLELKPGDRHTWSVTDTSTTEYLLVTAGQILLDDQTRLSPGQVYTAAVDDAPGGHLCTAGGGQPATAVIVRTAR
ncbi:hypothetical protein GOHSU_22_01140 [Gordonia hirsuta DSM 44140 = NBRC 16056]|uniref:Uncharacterized protein n=1 Tax=Gordonia hirsuta DSM 44140 = NBRC 16056 TaxID=1121927 RepID=L7L9Q6_9ACTN|nr:hypothetical protein [Gordonia hirsuta]GAC57654.1 hypothetical protein GOHSU_22_01140 [Gordonia hirsuta DSM 44140 = NBRC 16056]